MTEQSLQDRVLAAINDHLAEQGGGMVSAFHLAVEYVSADGDEGWLYATAPDQRMSRTLGLIEWSAGVARYEQQCYLQTLRDE